MANMSLEVNGHSFKTHYPNDDLKRVLMVFPETENKAIIDKISAEIQAISDEVLTVTKERISKVFYLKEYTEFSSKYSLLCVPAPCTSEKQAVISQSRFPSEIKKGQVYIGNLTNVMGKDNVQLKMLGIKTIVHLTPQKFD